MTQQCAVCGSELQYHITCGEKCAWRECPSCKVVMDTKGKWFVRLPIDPMPKEPTT